MFEQPPFDYSRWSGARSETTTSCPSVLRSRFVLLHLPCPGHVPRLGLSTTSVVSRGASNASGGGYNDHHRFIDRSTERLGLLPKVKQQRRGRAGLHTPNEGPNCKARALSPLQRYYLLLRAQVEKGRGTLSF